MPVNLAQQFIDEIEKPQGSSALVWLLELEIAVPYQVGPTTIPGVIFRAANYPSEIVWPPSDPNGPITWYPFNFGFTPIEQNSEGDLPQVELTVDNSTRTLMRYLHTGNGFEGNLCKLYLVPEDALTVAHPNHVFQLWELAIAGTVANDEVVSFRLENPNYFTLRRPQDRYVAGRCRWAFGSEECGYIKNVIAAYQTCPKTLDACIARGQDHAARGLPVVHPDRFGAFPGIPRQR